MAVYDLGFYHTNNTPIDVGNPLAFGRVDPGMISDVLRFHIWNDKDGLVGADLAPTPRLFAVSDPDNVGVMFNGTALNGFKSMLEARSCRAVGVAADQHTEWKPIGPNELLVMGDIPASAMREIEIRLRVPADSGPMTPSKSWQLRVTA